MKNTTRLTESELVRLIKKIINEDESSAPPQVIDCYRLMKLKPGVIGQGPSVTLESGTVELRDRGPVSPEYQGMDVIVNGKKFCFIKK